MSELEDSFEFWLKSLRIVNYEREHRFGEGRYEKRKWRFDFAWPDQKVAAEVEGGHWAGGRHSRGAGFIKDMEKYNAAAELGWRVFRFTDRELKHGEAAQQIARVLEQGV